MSHCGTLMSCSSETSWPAATPESHVTKQETHHTVKDRCCVAHHVKRRVWARIDPWSVPTNYRTFSSLQIQTLIVFGTHKTLSGQTRLVGSTKSQKEHLSLIFFCSLNLNCFLITVHVVSPFDEVSSDFRTLNIYSTDLTVKSTLSSKLHSDGRHLQV